MTKRWTDFSRPFSLPAILFLVFVLASVTSLSAGVYLYAAPHNIAKGLSNTQPSTPQQSGLMQPSAVDLDKLTVEYDELKTLMASVEQREDNLQKLLATLVTIGTLFGLAVGFSTYSNLKDIQKNTETAVTQLVTKGKQDLEELRSDFPAIGHMNRAIDEILVELQSMFHNWDHRRYAQMSELERQQVLMAELTFNGLKPFIFHKSPISKHKIGKINRGLGLFYAGRYTKTPTNNEPDFQRAVLYLTGSANDSDIEESAAAYQDLGIFLNKQSALVSDSLAALALLKEAEMNFKAALFKNDSDPGSLAGLAWIQKRTGRLSGAVLNISNVIENPNLSLAEQKRFLWRAYLNRACYLVLDADQVGNESKTKMFSNALADLKLSREVAQKFGQQTEQTEALVKEVTIGDLVALQNQYSDEIKALTAI